MTLFFPTSEVTIFIPNHQATMMTEGAVNIAPMGDVGSIAVNDAGILCIKQATMNRK
jgi:hypothetical protein